MICMHQELILNFIALMQVGIWFLISTLVCIKLSQLRANLNNSEILILNMLWGQVICVAGFVALPSHL